MGNLALRNLKIYIQLYLRTDVDWMRKMKILPSFVDFGLGRSLGLMRDLNARRGFEPLSETPLTTTRVCRCSPLASKPDLSLMTVADGQALPNPRCMVQGRVALPSRP